MAATPDNTGESHEVIVFHVVKYFNKIREHSSRMGNRGVTANRRTATPAAPVSPSSKQRSANCARNCASSRRCSDATLAIHLCPHLLTRPRPLLPIEAGLVKYVDETRWKRPGKQYWQGATAQMAAFTVHADRELDGLAVLSGAIVVAIVVSDRGSV